METPLGKAIESLLPKIELLAESRDAALALAEQLKAENTELRLRLQETEEQLRRSRLDTEYLTVSHKLAASPQALADARRTLRRLVEKVDKAIRLLSDDPAAI